MSSIWVNETQLPAFEPLRGDRSVDVLVIGGGMAGLLCALMLRRAGADCLVVEASRICSGATKNTTAKLTAQHGLIYHRIGKDQGWERAAEYLRANQRALEEFRKLCAHIDCGFEERDSYVYTLDAPGELKKEQAALERLGAKVEWAGQTGLPFQTAGALCMPKQAQFHPLKFIRGILPELDVCEQTMVRRLEGTTAVTDRGRIRAKQVVFCTHFPFLNRRGCYFMKMYQHRSYVLALEGAKLPEGIYVDQKEDGLSFRTASGFVLLGGGDHRTGSQGGGWQELRRVARRYYPNSREVAHWAAQDCMTLDGVPYIGRYSPATPGWYVATGFNKWGMTSSMVSALLLRDMVLGKEADWGRVFDPARRMKAAPLASNLLTAAGHLLTPSLRRCPHMGCALSWNRAEHSWDCPCHGSRFDEHGALVDNPATRDWKGAPEEQPHS